MGVLDEVRDILESSEPRTEAHGYRSSWDMDLAVFAAARVIEVCGLDVMEGRSRDIDDTIMDIFPAPWTVRGAPFPDSIEMWEECVVDILSEGVSLAFRGHEPNLRAVSRLWLDRVEGRYGYRLTASAEGQFVQAVADAVEEAAENISSKQSRIHVDRDAVMEAAKILAV